MTLSLDRRSFIGTGVTAAAAASLTLGASTAHANERNIKKTLKMGMITSTGEGGQPLSVQERFQIALDARFVAVEPDTLFSQEEVDEYKRASEETGLLIDAVVCSRHWSHPLSHPDPATADVCMEAMKISIDNAKELGGDMVLLVPAVVNAGVMYRDAWARSMPRVKELSKYAEDQGIVIGIENVWNWFLLSPLEFRAYIEEADSPSVQAWFDIGNVVLYGWPQDWIRTLDERIARIDVKDFTKNGYRFVELLQGDVNWPETMKALDEIGYEGYFAAEVAGGGVEYLTEAVSKPMDQMIAM